MATALITEAEAKEQLKLDASDPTTPRLTRSIATATRWVEDAVGHPIVDRDDDFRVTPPAADSAVVIPRIYVTAAKVAQDVAPSAITQLDGYTSALVAPSGGWPDKVTSPAGEFGTVPVSITQSVPDAAVDPRWKDAALVMLFAIYYDPSAQEWQRTEEAAGGLVRQTRTLPFTP